MGKAKKKWNQTQAETSIAQIPISVIVPLPDLESNIPFFFQSLQKIRKPGQKDFEIIFVASDTGKIKERIKDFQTGQGNDNLDFFKLVSAEKGTGTAGAIKTGLEQSGKKNILIFDASALENSFNFDELFNISQDQIERQQLIIPLFRKQEWDPGKKNWPMILLPAKLAKYLIMDLEAVHTDFRTDLFYRMAQLGISPGTYSVSQVSPFPGQEKTNKQFIAGIKSRSSLFIDWFIRTPLREIKTKPHLKYDFLKIPSYFRSLFVLSAILIAIGLPLLSLEAGLSGDDTKHYQHAEKVYNFFSTRGEDESAISDPQHKLNYYGQSFDLLTYVFNRIFNIENEYEARHVLIALSGVLCILVTGLLAVFLAGYRAGLITMVLMFFSPRFIGHSLNNPLDVPFSLGYVFTIYHIFRFLEKLPSFSKRNAIWIALGIAYTTSIRIGGMVLIPYAFMFAGIYIVTRKFNFRLFSTEGFSMLKKGVVFLVLISLAGYFLSLLPWPYALKAPLKNPFESLKMMSNISVAIRVLFNGDIIWSNKLPWYYISMNILYTVPVLLLAGFLGNFLFYRYNREKIRPVYIFFLYFSVLFPLIYIIYKESNVYGGWRHMMWIFPSMVVLAAISFESLFRILKNKYLVAGMSAVMIAGIAHPAFHMIKNHPFQYIYFNELLGVDKAMGRFETDYYLNSLRQGSEWVIENIIEKDESADKDHKLKITSNGGIDYYFRNITDKASSLYTRYYDRGAQDWDYGIFFCNYIDPYQIDHGLWPPANTIHTIDVNHVPICAIVKRKNKKDFEGISAVDRNDLLNGISILEEVNREDPNNEIVKLKLAEAYLKTRDYAKVHAIVEECLKIYPEYDKALNFKGVAYLENNELQKAIAVFRQIIRINYRFASAYVNLAIAYVNQKPPDPETAKKYLEKAIEVNKNYQPAYSVMAQILSQQGQTELAKRYQEMANSLR